MPTTTTRGPSIRTLQDRLRALKGEIATRAEEVDRRTTALARGHGEVDARSRENRNRIRDLAENVDDLNQVTLRHEDRLDNHDARISALGRPFGVAEWVAVLIVGLAGFVLASWLAPGFVREVSWGLLCWAALWGILTASAAGFILAAIPTDSSDQGVEESDDVEDDTEAGGDS